MRKQGSIGFLASREINRLLDWYLDLCCSFFSFEPLFLLVLVLETVLNGLN